MKTKIMKVTRSLASDMAAISGLDADDVNPAINANQVPNEGTLEKDSAALGQLMDNLKSKFHDEGLSHADKMQVLTDSSSCFLGSKENC